MPRTRNQAKQAASNSEPAETNINNTSSMQNMNQDDHNSKITVDVDGIQILMTPTQFLQYRREEQDREDRLRREDQEREDRLKREEQDREVISSNTSDSIIDKKSCDSY